MDRIELDNEVINELNSNNLVIKNEVVININKHKFDNITIFYGGNGSGKSTLINMISQKLNAKTLNGINKGSYFDEYVKLCKYEMAYDEPLEI